MAKAFLEGWSAGYLSASLATLSCLVPAANVGAEEVPALYQLVRGGSKTGDLKVGFIDGSGRVIIPAQYENAGKFVEGRASVKIAGKFGFIDHRGQLVVPAIYQYVGEYSEGLAVVRSEDRQWSVIDSSGTVIVPPKYDWIGNSSEGLIPVGARANAREPMQYGAIDTAGKLVVEMKYEALGSFRNGLAVAKTGGKYGYVSKAGELVIPAIYKYANPFVDGLANVSVKNADGKTKQAIIDTRGAYVIPPVHDYAGKFQDGKSIAFDTGIKTALHVYDRSGKLVRGNIDAKTLCDRNPYKSWGADNLAVRKSPDGECFYADADGRNRFVREFEGAWPFANGLAVVRVGAKEAFGSLSSKRRFAGVINETGAFVVPAMFDEIWVDESGPIKVRWKDRREEYLDRTGRPLTFSDADLVKYTEEMRSYFAPPLRDPKHSIAAQAADGAYYLSLPNEICVLDKADLSDRRILDAMVGREPLPGGTSLGDPGTKRPHADEASLSLFASCDELKSYRDTKDLQKLTRIGFATASRRTPRDPSGNAALPFVARMICGGLRRGSAGKLPQAEQQKSDEIAEAWKQASRGIAVQLQSVKMQQLGCTSAGLRGNGQGGVVANFMTLAMLPDWILSVVRLATPGSKDQFVELLREESEAINIITKKAIAAMEVDAR